MNEAPAVLTAFLDLTIKLSNLVSIARRLQDPLAEYVKIEPSHLGVGMYQHSINEKDLDKALDLVVRECVSYVGVDVNTASQELLEKVSGLNSTIAKNVLLGRAEIGRFQSREELMLVRGIDSQVFEQCAGFINVYQNESISNRAKVPYQSLDATMVHPESYDLAKKIISFVGYGLADVGTNDFCNAVDQNKIQIARYFETRPHVESVIEALSRPLHYDMRKGRMGAIFRQSCRTIQDLADGMSLTGVVNNVTDFGAFVDIGVGINGLIHLSALPKNSTDDIHMLLQINCHVDVTVSNVDIVRDKIGLRLNAINGIPLQM
uniref:S1 motif domain-containing protein n=1 Tax=Plectus sambesii TaxID=2011161 RepID=A0A914WN97_9BILA